MFDYISELWDSVPKKTIGAALVGSVLAAAVHFGFDTAGRNIPAPVASSLAQTNQVGTVAATWLPYCSQGAQIVSTAHDNAVALEQSPLYADAYFLLDAQHTGKAAVDMAYAAITNNGADTAAWDNLDKVWVDYEVPTECRPVYNVPWATVIQALQEINALGKPCFVVPLAQSECGIYTNADNYLNVLGSPKWPDGTWSWIASWDGKPDLYATNLFGDLTKDEVWAKQYQGDTVLPDLTVDLDSFFFDFPPKPLPAPPSPCANGSFEWSPGECASWNGSVWLSPLRVYLPLGSGPGLWFDRKTGQLVH